MAGVWAHHVLGENLLEEGDLEEALNAASGVGDDRIQKQHKAMLFRIASRTVPPNRESGGFKSGNMNEGDTFKASNL